MVKRKEYGQTKAEQLPHPTANAKLQRELNKWVKPIEERLRMYNLTFFEGKVRWTAYVVPTIKGKTAGNCSAGSYRSVLKFSLWYLRNATEEQWKETVYHELLHAYQKRIGRPVAHDNFFVQKYIEHGWITEEQREFFGSICRFAYSHQVTMRNVTKPVVKKPKPKDKHIWYSELEGKVKQVGKIKDEGERVILSFQHKGAIFKAYYKVETYSQTKNSWRGKRTPTRMTKKLKTTKKITNRTLWNALREAIDYQEILKFLKDSDKVKLDNSIYEFEYDGLIYRAYLDNYGGILKLTEDKGTEEKCKRGNFYHAANMIAMVEWQCPYCEYRPSCLGKKMSQLNAEAHLEQHDLSKDERVEALQQS
jgi:hypothetical protein